LAWHLGVLCLLASLVAARHFLTPFFHCIAECACWVTGMDRPGYPWRLTQIWLFNDFALRQFGAWWGGFYLLCGGVTLGTAYLSYLFWVSFAPAAWPGAGAVSLGRRAGLLAGALLILLDFRYISDITAISYRMAALTSVLAMVFTVRFARGGRKGWWMAALGAYTVGCISNAFAWLLPLFLFVLEVAVWPAGRLRRRLPWAVLRLVIMMGVLSGFMLWVVGTDELSGRFFGALDRAASPEQGHPLMLLSSYVYKVAIYPYLYQGLGLPDPVAGPAAYLAEALFLLAGLYGAWRLVRRRPHGFFSMLFLLVLLWFALTVPQQYGAGDTWIATSHRFSYLRLGLALMGGWGVAAGLVWLTRRLPARTGRLTADLGILLLVGAGAVVVGAGQGAANLVSERTWQLPGACAAARSCNPDGSKSRAGIPGPCADLSHQKVPGSGTANLDLSRADLTGASMWKGTFKGVNLQQACAYWADMRKANLAGARLAGAELVGAFLNKSDLTRADLRGADMRAVSLAGTQLSGANLSGVDLLNAQLGGANLRGANLAGARLVRAEVVNVDLREADLRGADLRYANLHEARLTGARLDGALVCESQKPAPGRGHTGALKLFSCPPEAPPEWLWPPPREH